MEYKIESLGGIKKEISYHTKLEEIKEYLSEEGIKLPEDYLSFSLKYGYGQFCKDVVSKSIDKIPIAYPDGTFPVTFIYGWGKDEDSLQETRIALIDQLPLSYFVFAEATAGDYLLINTINYKIYYYLHDEVDDKAFFFSC